MKQRTTLNLGVAIALLALLTLACDLGALTTSNTSNPSAATQQTLEAEVQKRVQQTAQAVKPIAVATTAPTVIVVVPTVSLAAPSATPAPVVATQNRRLNTGTIVKRGATWSAGAESYMLISNPTPLDAVVILSENNAVGIAIYVRAAGNFKLENVPTGSYEFAYVLGEDWDANVARFTRNVEYHKFIKPMNFTRTLNLSNATYTYTYWDTPLTTQNQDPEQPVVNANEFPNLK